MSIQELYAKFKGSDRAPEVLLSVLILVVALVSFLLGRASVLTLASSEALIRETATKTEEETRPAAVVKAVSERAVESTKTTPPTSPQGGYVASKNGTKYHLPWCGSAKQIKEENKIYFATKEEAESAGYAPASNCKGI